MPARRIVIPLVVLVVALAAVAWWAFDTYNTARAAQAEASGLQALADKGKGLQGDDVKDAIGRVGRLRLDLEHLQRNLTPVRPVVGLAAGVSGQARRAEMALRTLDLGVEVVAAGDELGAAARPLLDGEGNGQPIGQRVAGFATQADPHLTAAADHLDRAAALRPGIDRFALQGRLAPLGQGLDRLDRALPPARDAVQQAREIVPALPALLGMDGPRSYLLLGQNERETRATGGFIGSMGLITLDKGQITAADFRSSYQFDNPQRQPVRPPQAMEKFMNAGAWYIRDANWWADFPTSAAQVQRFWEADHDSQADGVFAIDEAAIGAIVDAVGPVPIPELGRAVSGQDLFSAGDERMSQADAVATGEAYRATKSRIVSQAIAGLVAKLPSLSPEQGGKLALAVADGLRHKHILVALDDQRLADALRAQGWDGALGGEPHADYLGLVDTTLAYTEMGAYVRRQARYSVETDAFGRVTRSVLEVTYRNTFNPAQASKVALFNAGGVYWDLASHSFKNEPGIWGDYVRLFVPRGTRLTSLEGLDYPPRYTLESDKTVLGGFFLLRPGETRTLRWEYVPPVAPDPADPQQVYRLLVRTQPGVAPYPLEVQASIAGRDRVVASRGGQTPGGGRASWTVNLDTDTALALRLP